MQTPGPFPIRASCVTIARQPPSNFSAVFRAAPIIARERSIRHEGKLLLICGACHGEAAAKTLFDLCCGGRATAGSSFRPRCVARESALGLPPSTAIAKVHALRFSRAFLPVLKESPSDAQIVSHKLMLRAGLIRQTAAGIYAWLPLGFRVLKKIEQIVREEQDRSGAQEMLMPTLQSAELWRESGRYDAYGPEMLRIRDRHEREMLYGPTNEEMLTAIVRDELKSYRELPRTLYHIQWKFRDEVRPRFGVMRGREFLMKDATRSTSTRPARATAITRSCWLIYARSSASASRRCR